MTVLSRGPVIWGPILQQFLLFVWGRRRRRRRRRRKRKKEKEGEEEEEKKRKAAVWCSRLLCIYGIFPQGGLYSGHIYSEIFCSDRTDKKAVQRGDNCAPSRQTTDSYIFPAIVSEAGEMLLCSGFKYRFISTQNTMGCIPKCVLMRNKY